MREIELTKGYKAQVDDDDFVWLNQWNWYADEKNNTVYAARREGKQCLYMHNVISGASGDMTTDHIDSDGWNNQRVNLRTATRSQQRMNSVGYGASGVKGVSFHHGRWRAVIFVQGKQVSLGRFDTIEEAASAYTTAARSYFGEFAFTEEEGQKEDG